MWAHMNILHLPQPVSLLSVYVNGRTQTAQACIVSVGTYDTLLHRESPQSEETAFGVGSGEDVTFFKS